MIEAESFQRMVLETRARKLQSESSYDLTSFPCYVHLKCDRGGSGLCLGWREVCDGRIDCVNGCADEAECFQLKRNDCDENEHRCHNRLCIPKVFSKDNRFLCLDQSNQLDEMLIDINPVLRILKIEERMCRSGSRQFSCGDEECVADYEHCRSKRHLLAIQSITLQGHLPDSFWMAMICLTQIATLLNHETSCEQMLPSSNLSTHLESCEELIQFPRVAVLSGHIRFLDRPKDHLNFDVNLAVLPDYICYDRQLCNFLTPTFSFQSYSCRKRDELNINWNVKPNSWISLIQLVDGYFRKCSTRYDRNEN